MVGTGKREKAKAWAKEQWRDVIAPIRKRTVNMEGHGRPEVVPSFETSPENRPSSPDENSRSTASRSPDPTLRPAADLELSHHQSSVHSKAEHAKDPIHPPRVDWKPPASSSFLEDPAFGSAGVPVPKSLKGKSPAVSVSEMVPKLPSDTRPKPPPRGFADMSPEDLSAPPPDDTKCEDIDNRKSVEIISQTSGSTPEPHEPKHRVVSSPEEGILVNKDEETPIDHNKISEMDEEERQNAEKGKEPIEERIRSLTRSRSPSIHSQADISVMIRSRQSSISFSEPESSRSAEERPRIQRTRTPLPRNIPPEPESLEDETGELQMQESQSPHQQSAGGAPSNPPSQDIPDVTGTSISPTSAHSSFIAPAINPSDPTDENRTVRERREEDPEGSYFQ